MTETADTTPHARDLCLCADCQQWRAEQRHESVEPDVPLLSRAAATVPVSGADSTP
jgi:hypothetical protein